MMYYVFQVFPTTFYQYIRSLIEVETHQLVIEDLKDPKHHLAIGIVHDITGLYIFDNFGSSSLPPVFIAHIDEVGKLWHARFDRLNYRSFNNYVDRIW